MVLPLPACHRGDVVRAAPLHSQGGRPSVAAAWVGTLAVVCVGQWLMVQPTPLAIAVAVWVAGLASFVWLQWPTLGETAPPTASRVGRLEPWRWVPWRWVMVAGALGAGVATWVRARGRPEDAIWTDVVVTWAVSMLCLVVAVSPRPVRRTLRRVGDRTTVPHRIALACVLVVAVVARFAALDRFPVVEGDGMSLALLARDVADGRLTDPFTTAYFDNPTLFPFLQRAVMGVLGESLFGARFLSALVGSLTVLCTYL